MKWLIPLLGVAATLLPTRDAHAWLQFCNKTDTTVSVAYQRYVGQCDTWGARGWWVLAPGECQMAQGGTLQNKNLSRYYYVYAKGVDGRVWEGPNQFRVTQQAFDTVPSVSKDGVCQLAQVQCPANGCPPSFYVGGAQIDVGKNANFSVDIQ